MKKVLISYFVYLLVIWCYFLYAYPLQTFSDTKYAAIAHAVFFSKIPLEWILLISLIKNKSSGMFQYIERVTKFEWLRTIIFALLLVLVYGLIRFPFNWYWFTVTHREGTRNQSFGDWLVEMGLDLLFYWIVLSIGLLVTRLLIRKFKKLWWFVLWLLAIPVAVFVVYVQPVWIDPLYEDFTEMEEGPIKTEIEAFIRSVGLEDATLLQVNMSEKVTTFNAYVTGIAGNARIVLWDTTLEGMKVDEILFILAHEVGHYVKHHVYLGVGGYLVLSFLLFLIVAVIFERFWKRGNKEEAHAKSSLRAMPSLLLTLSLLLTISLPISNYVSRQMERVADAYAIQHTENLEPAINSFQRLAIQSKSDIDPVFWVKWMRYTHPPMVERIRQVEEELERRETNN